MKKFMDQDFLLESETARQLYHGHAEPMPVIDYDCRLDARKVAEDYRFKSITELWIEDDVSKWNIMRMNDTDVEKLKTENDDWQKFDMWAEAVGNALRNPIYHWTHMELKRIFGIDKLLNKDTAREIYEECNRKLANADFSVRGIMRKFNVECIGSEEDPTDDLSFHETMQSSEDAACSLTMLPVWHPVKALNIEGDGYAAYIHRLEETANTEITSYRDLMDVLQARHEYFQAHHCVVSNLDIYEFSDEAHTDSQIETIFEKAMRGQSLPEFEVKQYKHSFLRRMSEMDFESNWTQQYHLWSVDSTQAARAMYRYLHGLDEEGRLPRTILYSQSPNANDIIASMLRTSSNIQFGLGWGLNNQAENMVQQINTLSSLGLLSRSIGVKSAARSFLDFSYHEYFRRLLCNMIGNDVERGILPADSDTLNRMVENICYYNVKNYLWTK
jgi:glucuronate isomerase